MTSFEDVRKKWDDNWSALKTWRVKTEEAISHYNGDGWVDVVDGALVPITRDGASLSSVPFIQVQARTVRAQLLKPRPIGEPKPANSSPRSILSAKAASQLVHQMAGKENVGYWQALGRAILWSILSGVGITKTYWNPATTRMPSIDDCRVRAISPFEIAFDPTAQNVHDCLWIIQRSVLSPEIVFSNWGVKLEPDAATTNRQIVRSALSRERDKAGVMVWEWWRRPCKTPENPEDQGEFIIFAGEKTLHSGPMPTERYPFVVWPLEESTDFIIGDSFIWQALPIQRYVNKAFTLLLDYLKKLPNPPILAPDGSIMTESEVNYRGMEIINFNMGAGTPPREVTLANPPQWVIQFLENMLKYAEIATGISATMQGRAPFAQVTGRAYALLLEQDQTTLGPCSQSLGRAVQEMTTLMLEGFRTYGPPVVTLEMDSEFGSEFREFAKAEIDWGDIVYEEGSLLNKSSAVFQESIERFTNLKIIDPASAMNILVKKGILGDESPFIDDIDLAKRNISRLLSSGEMPPLEDFYAFAVHGEVWIAWAKSEVWETVDDGIRNIARQYIQMLKDKVSPPAPPQEPGEVPPPPPEGGPIQDQGDGGTLPELDGQFAEGQLPLVQEPGAQTGEDFQLRNRIGA